MSGEKGRAIINDGFCYAALTNIPSAIMFQIRTWLLQDTKRWFIMEGFYTPSKEPSHPLPSVTFKALWPVPDAVEYQGEEIEPAEWIGDPARCEECGSLEHRDIDCTIEEEISCAIICSTCEKGIVLVLCSTLS
jgi:hypothetical protein